MRSVAKSVLLGIEGSARGYHPAVMTAVITTTPEEPFASLHSSDYRWVAEEQLESQVLLASLPCALSGEPSRTHRHNTGRTTLLRGDVTAKLSNTDMLLSAAIKRRRQTSGLPIAFSPLERGLQWSRGCETVRILSRVPALPVMPVSYGISYRGIGCYPGLPQRTPNEAVSVDITMPAIAQQNVCELR